MTDTPTTSPSAAAGLARGGGPETGVLLILAVDHRASLERDLYGLTAPPTLAQAARISADGCPQCRAAVAAGLAVRGRTGLHREGE